MGKGVIIAAAVVTSLGLLLGAIATFIPYWEVNDPTTTTKDNIVRVRNYSSQVGLSSNDRLGYMQV